jgi:hypothetical protein
LKEEDKKDEVTKVNEEERSSKEEEDKDGGEKYTEKVIKKRMEKEGERHHSPSVLSILLFIFLPSCPLPHTYQLCLPALSKLEFFSLALKKIALSLKSVFPIQRTEGEWYKDMEKDGDSEEDNDEEVVKQVVKRRFEGRG